MYAYLVKGREYVVCELDFGNGGVTHDGETNAKARNTLFCQRSVEDSLAA